MIQAFCLFIFTFGFLTLTSCSATAHEPVEIDPACPVIGLTARFRNAEASLLEKQYNMFCHMKGGSTTNPIQTISFGFKVPKKLSKEEGRELLINCVNQILAHANQSEELKNHMPAGGFTQKNIRCDLYTDTYYPDFCIFGFANNEVAYLALEKNSNEPGFHYEEYESYEEARNILIKQGKISGDDIIQP